MKGIIKQQIGTLQIYGGEKGESDLRLERGGVALYYEGKMERRQSSTIRDNEKKRQPIVQSEVMMMMMVMMMMVMMVMVMMMRWMLAV